MLKYLFRNLLDKFDSILHLCRRIKSNDCSPNWLRRKTIYITLFVSAIQKLSGYFVFAVRFCSFIYAMFLPLQYKSVDYLLIFIFSISSWNGLLQITQYGILVSIPVQSDTKTVNYSSNNF